MMECPKYHKHTMIYQNCKKCGDSGSDKNGYPCDGCYAKGRFYVCSGCEYKEYV